MERKYGLRFLPAVLSPLSVCDGDAAAGLMTYNGALVGCAFAVFLPGQGIGPSGKPFRSLLLVSYQDHPMLSVSSCDRPFFRTVPG